MASAHQPKETLTAVNDAVTVSGLCPAVDFQLEDGGSWNGTVTFEAKIGDGPWVALRAEKLDAGTFATTATAAGLYRVVAEGLSAVRCRASTVTGGTLIVRGQPAFRG